MVIFTKKIGQLKQWTGEKLGSTEKTQKPAEVKLLQQETKSRFDGIGDIRNSLKEYMKSLDENKKSSLGLFARSISAQSMFHANHDFGAMLIVFGDGMYQLSEHQKKLAEEIKGGLLMSLDALLNESSKFDQLRKKLKNRRLDFDANNNKLQKSKKENPSLEENVKMTKFKYDESLEKLEEMMISVSAQETNLIEPIISFVEAQVDFFRKSIDVSNTLLKVLKENQSNAKSVDFIAESFRKEIEELDIRENVDKIESNNASGRNSALNFRIVRANFNFKAENENELSLKKGDLIKVTKYIDEGWWFGCCNGKKGMFPSNYVSDTDA